MKKLVLAFLLLSFTFIAQGQDTKPTKEQTSQYIQNYVARKSVYSWVHEYKEDKYKTTLFSTYKDFVIKECILTATEIVETREESYVRDTDRRRIIAENKLQIDLSKCEEIRCVSPFENEDGSLRTSTYILFSSANNAKSFLSNVESVNEILIEVDGSITRDSEIFKAFNHLRKLCGAPEPIKF